MSDLENQHRTFYDSDDLQRFGRARMPEDLARVERWLQRLEVPSAERSVLELGAGLGPLSGVHPGYIGLELSVQALARFARRVPRVSADMQRIPFRNESVGVVFSWAAIEHVPAPEKVFDEIARILRPGGVAVLWPAWNCRPWAAKGLPIRRWSELEWRDRIVKALIPVRNHILWLAFAAMPGRLLRELRFLLTRAPLPFDYRRLEPNLTEYVYTDCDAFTSMDSHAALAFFVSRGFEVPSHPGLAKRLLARNEIIVVRKPDARDR